MREDNMKKTDDCIIRRFIFMCMQGGTEYGTKSHAGGFKGSRLETKA
jgi:hypothetical protein